MSSINPYEVPLSIPSTAPTQHRVKPTRARLRSLLSAYFKRKITAEQFEQFVKPYQDSADPVIQFVMRRFVDLEEMEYAFEDREAWNYFQRGLFCLSDNTEIMESRSKPSTSLLGNFLALAALFVMLGAFAYYGLQIWIFLVAGIVTGIVAALNGSTFSKPETDPYLEIIHPFATFGDLERVYRSSKFRKTKFQKKHSIEKRRNVLFFAIEILLGGLLFSLFSPILLLVLANPFAGYVTRVCVPEQSSS